MLGIVFYPPYFKFQSTRSARSATSHIQQKRYRSRDFNPRAPRGARHKQFIYDSYACRFQSTRSARSATLLSLQSFRCRQDFNPRAPRGARPGGFRPAPAVIRFQSTRSARSATSSCQIFTLPIIAFQSTRSARSATEGARQRAAAP